MSQEPVEFYMSIPGHKKPWIMIVVMCVLVCCAAPRMLSASDTNESMVKAAQTALANAPKNACPEGFAYIPGGPFVMGSMSGESDERPVHTVSTDAYCMAIHETTNAEYLKVIPDNFDHMGSRKDFPKELSGPHKPVIYVDWGGSDAYCKKSGGRLPTEAEWEKAARGPKGLEYGTNSGKLSKAEANYANFKNMDVCSYPKNDYGLCDMAGNVWEWTNDWYSADAYMRSKAQNPKGPASGDDKVVRDGSFGRITDVLRATHRYGSNPLDRNDWLGFRCVVSPEKHIK